MGGPAAVARQLTELAEATGVQELMVTTTVHDHADRVRSYELVAEVGGLVPSAA